MLAAGVDGCRAGWICVTRDRAGRIASGCYPSARALFAQRPAPGVIAIDIPIGLPDAGPRECDREARRRLARRGSSVFPAPLRAVLRARDWKRACEIRYRIEGKRMSLQAFAILPKIREVDAALRDPSRRSPVVREVHPEVSFAAWRGRPMRHGKKSQPGRRERLALVAAEFGADAFDSVRSGYLVKDVGSDDILDAFAALWTAERILAGSEATLPATVARDSAGLPMEIVL